MPPKSPGRTPKWKPEEIKEAWKTLRREKPTANKTDLAKLLNMSVSRVRAILNNHPSARGREIENLSQHQPALKIVQEEKKAKSSGLQFYPLSSWDDWS